MTGTTNLSSLLIDPDLAADGVWVTIRGHFKVRVRRATSPAYRQIVTRETIMEMHKAKLTDAEELSEEAMQRITVRGMSRGLVVDWQGLGDDEDNEIPFSPEKAEEILSMPEAYEIVQRIEQAAMDRERFSTSPEEGDLGKSGAGSNGTPGTPDPEAAI